MVDKKYYQHLWSPIVKPEGDFKSALLDGSSEYEATLPLVELINEGEFDRFESVEWITGGFDLGDKSTFSIPSNFKIFYWPTFFFTHGLAHLETFKWWPDVEDTIFNPPNITHKFISYNRKPHDYRCLLIDKLAQNNLIKDNLISWQMISPDFKFNYFSQEILTIDQPNPDMGDMREMHAYAPQHANTFMQLISESSINSPIFITEKTVKALVFGDIFLTLGPRGYYEKLKDLGFELYTEIFNYDFDYKDIHSRIQGIINNISQLPNNVDELREIKKNLIDKRVNNYYRALDIGRYSKHIPSSTLNMLRGNLHNFPEDTSTKFALKYLNTWNQDIFS